MAASDEEGEILPEITDYAFFDSNHSAISFSVLPVVYNDDDDDDYGSSSGLEEVFVLGSCDGGPEMYKRATAWKFDLSGDNPVICVLSEERNWFVLQKPSKIYEPIVSSILVTVHWLHFSNKDGDGRTWIRFVDSFSSLDVIPRKIHLEDHEILIEEAKRRHKDLANSEGSPLFTKSPPNSTDVNKEVDEEFQAEDELSNYDDSDCDDQGLQECEEEENEEEEEDDNYFDTVCAICDDGGSLLCCNGMCMRSFHPTPEEGERTDCVSLGFSRKEEFETMQDFLCKNCLHQQHQCFVCGRLGSSDKSSNPEVFQCATASCGHFYHAECVTQLLYPRDKTTAANLRWRISAGESFICPAHKCYNCKKVEDMSCDEMTFAICRRCPKSYHRQCLPSGIKFESDGSSVPRAWPDLLHHHRILIYCMDHAIDTRLGTPARDHLVFPGEVPRKRKKQIQEPATDHLGFPDEVPRLKTKQIQEPARDHLGFPDEVPRLKTKQIQEPARDHMGFHDEVPRQRTKQIEELVADARTKVAAPEGGSMNLEKLAIDASSVNKSKFVFKIDNSTNRIEKRCLEKPPQQQQQQQQQQKQQQQQHLGSTTNKKMRTGGKVKMLIDIPPARDKKVAFGSTFTMPSGTKTAATLGSSAFISSSSSGATTKASTLPLPPKCLSKPPQPPIQKDPPPSESYLQTLTDLPAIDEAQFKRRFAKLREDTAEKFEEEKKAILERAREAGCHGRTSTFVKSITVGRMENYVQAIRLAKETLENGGSIEDAQVVCPRDTITTLFKWRSRITGYIQPFLHGMRYTSFGRHFTKQEKLQEIVNRLHYYVRDNDMIVDFCCGSNDFSLLMKEKLEATGKSCLFKNYDLIQTKNDFCFEKRDWMQVQPSELPDGSRLIMGLNPPFGYKATQANAFIRQALEFRPKLLILIVPKETKRVDAVGPYNLIWEDARLLSGRAFYLPGSVDIHNRQLDDWNKSAPPLSLWSRKDFTAEHLKIARRSNHLGGSHLGDEEDNRNHLKIGRRSNHIAGSPRRDEIRLHDVAMEEEEDNRNHLKIGRRSNHIAGGQRGDEIRLQDVAMEEAEDNRNHGNSPRQHLQLDLETSTHDPAAAAAAAADGDGFPGESSNSGKSWSNQKGGEASSDEVAAPPDDDGSDMETWSPTHLPDHLDGAPLPPPPPLLPVPPPMIYGGSPYGAFTYFPKPPMGSWPQQLYQFTPTFPAAAHQTPQVQPQIVLPPPPGLFTFRAPRN